MLAAAGQALAAHEHWLATKRSRASQATTTLEAAFQTFCP